MSFYSKIWAFVEIAVAVSILSPVHIRTFTPALWHVSTASVTPGRNGSISAKMPTMVSPLSTAS